MLLFGACKVTTSQQTGHLCAVQGAEDTHQLLHAAARRAVHVFDIWRLQQALQLLHHVAVRVAVKGADALYHAVQRRLCAVDTGNSAGSCKHDIDMTLRIHLRDLGTPDSSRWPT